MTTITEIKKQALQENDLEISWELLEHPDAAGEVLKAINLVAQSVPGLEHIYTALVEGTTSLVDIDRDEAIEACADELYAAYQMVDILERYNTIERLTTVS